MKNYSCKTCLAEKSASEFRIHKQGYRIRKCRECERQYQREWSKNNLEKCRARKRESMAKKRAADINAAREYGRNYHHKNRDSNCEKMRNYHARRFFWSKSMKLRGEGKANAKELALLWRSQKGLCALTGRKLDRTAQLDHKHPKARGGGDQISNLQWLCEDANLAKRALTDKEFIALCGDVMRWLGERIQMMNDL